MTLEEIFTEVRQLLVKIEDLGTDNDFINYANDCQENLVKRLPEKDLLTLQERKAYASGDIADGEIIDDSGLCELPSDFLREVIVMDSSQKINAIFIDLDDLAIFQSSGYVTPSASEPIYFLTRKSDKNYVGYVPKPSALLLLYYKQPTTFTAIANTPQVNVGTHHLFVPYLCWKITGDTKYRDEYNEGLKSRGGT